MKGVGVMRITDLLSKESIKLNLSSKTKPDVIDEW